MLLGSIIIGYFVTSSALVDKLKHVRNSTTKVYAALFMALLMVALEALMMLKTSQMACAVLLGSVAMAGVILLALRRQLGVTDVDYMRAMVQHHSSAILTSRATLQRTRNPAVRQLAQQIIDSQESEITLMDALIDNERL